MATTPTREPAGAVTGYAHPLYAQSHLEFGTPLELPRSRGWIIQRTIPGFPDRDAMGCYPMFTCGDWSQLGVDLEALREPLVCLSLVTDPFGDYNEADLRSWFPDLAVPFKEHYVVDLEKPRNKVISKHHRYETRKALKTVSIHQHPDPSAFLDTWMALHDNLIEKHHIEGVSAFSRSAFAQQLVTPGMVLLWASCGDEPVAAIMYFAQGQTVYAHILGCNHLGYTHGALYALISAAIEHFTGTARWLDLMGVPGAADSGSEGIRQFKRGWTRETRTAWLCGRIFNRARYAELVSATGTALTNYFPAYRDGEMARAASRPAAGDEPDGTMP